MKPLDVKIKIALLIALLLLVGMVLLDMVMVVAAQRMLLQSEREKGLVLVKLVGARIGSRPERGGLQGGHPEELQSVLKAENVSAVLWLDGASGPVYWLLGRETETAPALARIAGLARKRQTVQVNTVGDTWGVFWHQKKYMILAGPVRNGAGVSSIAGISIQLEPIYSRLRKIHKTILGYLLINTVLLSLIGLYRIHRIALRPVMKIVRRAEAFRPGDSAFLLEEENGENELSRLSRALNRVLDLNRMDQEALRKTVARLEEALRKLKVAQREIILAEKHVTVGRLSTGIAHEIGNPIGIVLGYLELIRQGVGEGDAELRDYICRAEDEIGRIRLIIRQLLDYSRPSEAGRRKVSIHSIVDDVIQMARLQPMFADIRVEERLGATRDVVSVDPDQLKQLFLNFMLNAADAIQMNEEGNSGLIRICSENGPVIDPDGGPSAGMLRVSFEDNGAGIPAAAVEKIFDPFFTTKPPGKGSGLGLWVSLLIAQAMGGKIDVDSAEGRGTRMILSLPVDSGGERGEAPIASLDGE